MRCLFATLLVTELILSILSIPIAGDSARAHEGGTSRLSVNVQNDPLDKSFEGRHWRTVPFPLPGPCSDCFPVLAAVQINNESIRVVDWQWSHARSSGRAGEPCQCLWLTDNAGRTWTRVLNPEWLVTSGKIEWDLHFYDPKTGWAMFPSDQVGGDPGVGDLWRTTDGGRSWQGVCSVGDDQLCPREVRFESRTHGFGFGWSQSPDGLLESFNGGKSWSRVKEFFGLWCGEVKFTPLGVEVFCSSETSVRWFRKRAGRWRSTVVERGPDFEHKWFFGPNGSWCRVQQTMKPTFEQSLDHFQTSVEVNSASCADQTRRRLAPARLAPA